MARPFTVEQLVWAYEMRHGLDKPMPLKIIADALGCSLVAICAAIKRAERRGIKKP